MDMQYIANLLDKAVFTIEHPKTLSIKETQEVTDALRRTATTLRRRARPQAPQAKLTDASVILMRQKAHREGQTRTAEHGKLFKVHYATIRKAVGGYTFKHLNKTYPPYIASP